MSEQLGAERPVLDQGQVLSASVGENQSHESHFDDNNAAALSDWDNSISSSLESLCCSEAGNQEDESATRNLPSASRAVRLHPILYKMINVAKEIGLLFLAIFFTYAALTNDPPKITKTPAAFPFFPKGSIVTDYYRGQISQAYEAARESDIAFVMFYAPWDAKSQDTRKEFDLAARYMQKLVTFTAVNCWQPGGECRSQYNKVYSWPVLIAYPAHSRGILYSGPRTTHHMMRFLNNVMKPLLRVTDQQEINLLLSYYDAVIVAEINALNGSPDFATAYTTALRLLEKDPFHEIGFAVRTVPDIKPDYFYPSLKLYMWNETMIYPTDEPFKTNNLLNWILHTIHQVTSWVSPLGTKSQQLSMYLQPGPTLILFTPRNPLANSVDYYDLLHQIGLEYLNCDNKITYKSMLLQLARLSNYYKHQFLNNNCPEGREKPNQKTGDKVVTFSLPACWTNNSCFSNSFDLEKSCKISELLKDEISNQCSTKDIEYLQIVEASKKLEFDCKSARNSDNLKSDLNDLKIIYKTSMFTNENDSRSPKNLLKIYKENECKLHQIAANYHKPIFSPTIHSQFKNDVNITGLACKHNTSLTLIALDSLKYHMFAERFGLDILSKTDKTAAIIIDEKQETHHVLANEILNDFNLRNFIFNYTQNNLPRTLQSSGKVFKNTHIYSPKTSSNDFFLRELTSETFLPFIMQENKASVVLYHSKQCSFCNGISYTFLTTAKSFSLVEEIRFARIDGDANNLPWEYTMERFPTILFFPARRKSESRAFPQTIPITVPNLVGFIVTNLDPSLKLHAMWSLCNKTKFFDEKQSCISSLRAEILTVIDSTLRDWRRSTISRIKAEILYNLRVLKNLHLLLAHSGDPSNLLQKYMKQLHDRPSLQQLMQYKNRKSIFSEGNSQRETL